MRRQLRALGVIARDCEDVAQEVLLDLSRARVTVAEGQTAAQARRALLHVVTRRKAAGYHHAVRRRAEVSPSGEEELTEGEQAADPPATPEEQALEAERLARLREALAAVPPLFREVLCRYELEGEPMAEVASDLGIPVNTGYTRLHLGRQRFGAAVRRVSACFNELFEARETRERA